MGIHRTVERTLLGEGEAHAAGAGRWGGKGLEVDTRAQSRVLGGSRTTLIVAALVAFVIVLWAAANFAADGAGFMILVPDKLLAGEEAASALTRLFAALVLGLFLSDNAAGWRLRWVAAGLVVLGIGHLTFGYLEPLIQGDPVELSESRYEALVTETLACMCFGIGLLAKTPPRLSVRVAASTFAAVLVTAYVLVFEFLEGDSWMPKMTRLEGTEGSVEFGTSLDWLTPLHWTFAALPLGLAIAAAVGAFHQNRRGVLPGWLLIAMVLFAGSLVHDYLWPSAFGGEVLTTADLLRLGFALVLAVGGIAELKRIASERAALLATERRLATLKADFSAMLAHELGGPVIAIRMLNEMLDAEGSDPKVRGYATAAIENEADTLSTLVADVRTAAAVERDDFGVEIKALPLMTLLSEAEGYASTLAGDHPVKVTLDRDLKASQLVQADPKRVGQVLRNLLLNAANYSPKGTPIEIRASRKAEQVRVEVADRGPGIQPGDLHRIFEKFERGCDQQGNATGAGLGLYLSRRIIRSHGSDLTVRSTLDTGSVFGFDLKVAR